ncbi:YwaF family protein [Bacillus solitudinis]|uniref:YwaF family protein n=1 Tax=Bacillus solitudinis TaxID=2014074 RepID=UPI001D0D56CF|nr:TIGR02206 family membrane protein [Bacillus solitudinis]
MNNTSKVMDNTKKLSICNFQFPKKGDSMTSSRFWEPTFYGEEALFLSSAHVLGIITLLLSLVWLYLHRNKLYMRSYIRWLLFTILICSELGILYWSISTGLWDIRSHLPLQLCTISLLICCWMLVSRQYVSFEIVYFFGIGGALQAILTPDLFYTFPHFRYLHFFIAHITIILAILFMVWVEKFRVTLYSALKSFLALNVIGAYVFMMNYILGTNYMYLARKPENPTIIDFLGPYPWYILSLEFVVVFIYILLYLPFYLTKKKSKSSNEVAP